MDPDQPGESMTAEEARRIAAQKGEPAPEFTVVLDKDREAARPFIDPIVAHCAPEAVEALARAFAAHREAHQEAAVALAVGAALTEPRETIRRLNRRCQELESKLVKQEKEWGRTPKRLLDASRHSAKLAAERDRYRDEAMAGRAYDRAFYSAGVVDLETIRARWLSLRAANEKIEKAGPSSPDTNPEQEK